MWLLHHPISAYDQFQTDFTSSVWNFCRWVTDVPHEMSPSGNEQRETSGFADWVIAQLRCPLGFILLSFAMNVVMGQRYTCRRWGKSLACGPYWQPVLRNSWCGVVPLKASCSAGRYFTQLLFHVTLTQVKSFDITINVAICLEQGAADLQMHIHEWLEWWRRLCKLKDIIARGKRSQVHRLVCDFH